MEEGFERQHGIEADFAEVAGEAVRDDLLTKRLGHGRRGRHRIDVFGHCIALNIGLDDRAAYRFRNGLKGGNGEGRSGGTDEYASGLLHGGSSFFSGLWSAATIRKRAAMPKTRTGEENREAERETMRVAVIRHFDTASYGQTTRKARPSKRILGLGRCTETSTERASEIEQTVLLATANVKEAARSRASSG